MAKTTKPKAEADLEMDRRRKDRRNAGTDRRKTDQPVEVERRLAPRRQKVQRRRQIDPTTCERDYSDAEVEFMNALDDYKRRSGRMFPTCSEILEVLRALGYEKRPLSDLAALAADSSPAAPAAEQPGRDETDDLPADEAEQE